MMDAVGHSQPPHPLMAAIRDELNRRRLGLPAQTHPISLSLARHMGPSFHDNPSTDSQQAWLLASTLSIDLGHQDILRLLLAASPFLISRTQDRLLCHAADHQDQRPSARMTRMLLDAGADPKPETAGVPARPPLFLAALNSHRDTVKLLLAAGADPNAIRCPQGKDYERECLTALAAAVRFHGPRERPVIRMLLAAGADPRQRAILETSQQQGAGVVERVVRIIDSSAAATSSFKALLLAAATHLDAQEQRAALDSTTPTPTRPSQPLARL